MKKILITITIVLVSFLTSKSQNSTCSTAAPFCTGTEYIFPAGVATGSAEIGPDYGCLGSEPNPAWYFMQIENPGDISIFMVGSNDPNGAPTNDIDFICYGPFQSLSNICNGTSLSAANTVDCSYSGSPTETVNITGAQTGEFYILLITNFSNQPCNITFSQNGGNGTTNCGILNSDANNNGPLCEGDTLFLTTALDPDLYSFQWIGPNGFSSNLTNPFIANVTLADSGLYQLIVSDLDTSDTATTFVEINPRPNPSSFSYTGVPCVGNQLILTPDSIYPNVVYTWAYPTNDTSNTVPLEITASLLLASQGVGLILSIDACSSAVTIEQIPVKQPIVPIIIGDDHTCFDEVAVISTSQTFDEYTWSTLDTTRINTVLPGAYLVTTTDSNGCIATSDTFFVTTSSPDAEIVGIVPYCQGDTLTLFASPSPIDFPYTNYYWIQDGDTLSTLDSVKIYNGNIELVVIDSKGCRDTIISSAPNTARPTANLNVNPGTPRVLVNTQIAFNDASTANPIDPIVAWDWYFQPPNDSSYLQNVNYTWARPDTGNKIITHIVISELGCRDTVIYKVRIIDTPYLPNVINPNSDIPNNARLKIPFLEDYPNNNVSIFNRWGRKVYDKDNYDNSWAGENLPEGTYFYVVSAPELSPTLKGTITLLRSNP
jgi:gliding motility-associated-like protein